MNTWMRGTGTPIWGTSGKEIVHRVVKTGNDYKTRCNGTTPKWQRLHDIDNAIEWITALTNATDEEMDGLLWFDWCSGCFKTSVYDPLFDDIKEFGTTEQLTKAKHI